MAQSEVNPLPRQSAMINSEVKDPKSDQKKGQGQGKQFFNKLLNQGKQMKQRQSAIIAGDEAQNLASKLQNQMDEKQPSVPIQRGKTAAKQEGLANVYESDSDGEDADETKQNTDAQKNQSAAAVTETSDQKNSA